MTPRSGERARPPAVVVAGDDVLFSTRIASTLRTLGYDPVIARTEDAFFSALAEAPGAGVVNLASYRFDALAAIRRAKADAALRGIPLLGFCGHRDEARRLAAREAGCDLVATNGAVAASLGSLLGSLLQKPARAP
jgi:DNA-binding response OmpR family regulator